MSELVKGSVERPFERVHDIFTAIVQRHDHLGEIGGSIAVYLHGQKVIDLWGGYRDEERTVPWTPDTLVNIWSTTKGIAAIEVAKLVDEGKLDYDAPVAKFWPEFAAAGKERITVAELMSHQAGLTGLVAPTTIEDFYAWDPVVERLAAQAPLWESGTKNSYHAMTFGFLAGELVRRASGKSVGRYLADEIAGPLGADVYIGLPESEEGRVTQLVPSPVEPKRLHDPADIPPEVRLAIANPELSREITTSRGWRAAEIPGGNGQATGLGIAKIYGALANGGSLGDVRLMSRATIDRLIELQTDRVDILLGEQPYWRMGLTGNTAGRFGPWEDTVGHAGLGGSLGCMNVERGLAIGCTVKQMGSQAIGDLRATELCNAICACL